MLESLPELRRARKERKVNDDRDKTIAEQAERIRLLEDAIRKMWPIVTTHTTVAFWGPIENKLRRRK